jgi:hypothetical protein
MTDTDLTPASLDLFRYIAGQAKHWDNMPPLEGMRPMSPADKGNLTDLKKRGLLKVREVDTDQHLVFFTDAGESLAKSLGIEI